MIGISRVSGVSRELLGDVPAVQPGQHDVEQDQIRPLGASERNRRLTVRGLEHVEPD